MAYLNTGGKKKCCHNWKNKNYSLMFSGYEYKLKGLKNTAACQHSVQSKGKFFGRNVKIKNSQ